MNENAGNKLSKQQKRILTTAAARPGTGRPLRAESQSWDRADVMFRDLLGEKPTPAGRAVLAKAVESLEKLGMITVSKWTLQRESGITLTDAGKQAVKKELEG
jgi:hypothetical protein